MYPEDIPTLCPPLEAEFDRDFSLPTLRQLILLIGQIAKAALPNPSKAPQRNPWLIIPPCSQTLSKFL